MDVNSFRELLEAGEISEALQLRLAAIEYEAQQYRQEVEAAKVSTAALMLVGAMLSVSPLVAVLAGCGAAAYGYTVYRDAHLTGRFCPLPLARRNAGELLASVSLMSAGQDVQDDPLMSVIGYIEPELAHEYELLMVAEAQLGAYLGQLPQQKRILAYGHILRHTRIRRSFSLPPLQDVAAAITKLEQPTPSPAVAPQPKPSQLEAPDPTTIDVEAETAVEEPGKVEDYLATAGGHADEETTDESSPEPQTLQTVEETIEPINGLHEHPSFAEEILQQLAQSPLCKIFGAVPGSGKTTLQRALIKQIIQSFPEAQIYITQTKRDPFFGLELVPSAILFSTPRRDSGSPLLAQAERASRILEYRSQFPAVEAKRLFRTKPVILLLCDYSDSIKQCSPEVRAELVKIIQQIFFNGRALNVQVWLDVQVLNQLTALGLDGSDSRSAAVMICLGAERPQEGGDFGVVENAVNGSSETFPNGFKAKIRPRLEQFKARSRETRRTLAVTPFMDAGAFLLPDWKTLEDERFPHTALDQIKQNLQSQKAELLVKPSIVEGEVKPLLKDSDQTTSNFKVSDALGEPLKTIWMFCKEQRKWVTTREIYQKSFAVLKGKTVNDIRRYLGLLSDKGYGEIDEMDGDIPKSDSSVAFRSY